MSKKLFINFSAVNWKYINWSSSRRYVSRLQRRIYKAAFSKKYGKMKQLQKRLLFSSHSKLFSILIVLQCNTSAQIKYCNITDYDKLSLAKYLAVNVSAYTIYLTHFIYVGIRKSRQKLLFTILKQARQFLAELALKPEWIGKSTQSLYIAKISNYSEERKIKKVIRSLHGNKKVYTITLKLDMYIMYGNYWGIKNKLSKFCTTFLQDEMRVWFEKENLLAFKTRKTVFNNLASHTGIKDNNLAVKIIISIFVCDLSNWLLSKRVFSRCQYYVNNSHLVFLCHNIYLHHDLISFITFWFLSIKVDTRLIQVSEGNLYKGFDLIGYRIQRLQQRIVITVSQKSKLLLWKELSKVVHTSKSISCDQLIRKLSYKIVFWGNYFQHTQCLKIFSFLDYLLHLKIWVWALRRHSSLSKSTIQLKYFPTSKQCVYRKQVINSKWILYGSTENTKITKKQEYFLIRFLWLQSLNDDRQSYKY